MPTSSAGTGHRRRPFWCEVEDLLTSVRGAGGVTARMLIAELPELGSVDRRKAAALVGVAPVSQDSGLQRGYHAIATAPARQQAASGPRIGKRWR